MEKGLKYTYRAAVIFSILLIVIACSNFRLKITQRESAQGCKIVTDYTYSEYEDEDAPIGLRREFAFQIDKVGDSYRELIFLTAHQEVEVYVGDECVYSMKASDRNFFGTSPGEVWNEVELRDEEAGAEVRIVLYPVYANSAARVPTIYFGEKAAVMRTVILQQSPSALLCLLALLVGVVFIVYALYNYKNPYVSKNIMMLGLFAIPLSLWKLFDLSGTFLLFPGVSGIQIIPLLMLQLLSVPFPLFAREMFRSRKSLLWYIPGISGMVVFFLSVLLQLCGVADLKETLWLTHLVLATIVVVTVGMTFTEVRRDGWSAKLRRNVVFMALCFVGLAADMLSYYFSKTGSTTIMGMTMFVIYIISVAYYSLKDAKKLMEIGREARDYEKIAHHDQLTGLYNRTAYADYTEGDKFAPEHCFVAVFDLNDLKKCNDTLGHEKGDIYIKAGADIIKKAFDGIGRCFRMGGDEFCVLVENAIYDVCWQRMQLIKTLVKEYNDADPEIHMGIAGGGELFDKRIDYDINDTSRRADRMMYHEKFSMKQAAGEEVR